ncbi:MAG: hypothetical protein AAF098_10475 [Pseudomonadota bacterium]
MTYSQEELARFHTEFLNAMTDLQDLMFRGGAEWHSSTDDHVRRFLAHGVGRRLSVLKRSIEEIFTIFPPDREAPLSNDEAVSLQIHLHAFLINLAGVFENWAWAFVQRHGLRPDLRPTQISVFKEETQRYLPKAILDVLGEHDIGTWHRDYAKEYRDALAHRIAPYIPPAGLNEEEQARHQKLQAVRERAIAEFDLDADDAARNEQLQLGTALPFFVHDINPDEEGGMVGLHGQLLSDILTVIVFGNVFYESWHERAD